MKNRILFLLFISGFSSLMYQVLFARLFNIVFGLFIHSTVIVITTYMLGLAFGYFLARNIKPKNGLTFYGYLELLIGIYSIFVFISFGFIEKMYVTLGNLFVVKFFLSILILLLPTVAMGLTLPVIVNYLKEVERNEMVDKVYGINAVGGSLGALLTSIVFINFFGLVVAFLVALLLNLAVFILAIVLSKEHKPKFEITKSSLPLTNVNLNFGLVAFIYGFCGMALEIMWYRLLVYFVANNTFSLSIILSVIILGISVGALLYKPIVNLIKSDLMLVVGTSIFTSLYIIFSIFILNNSYNITGVIYNILGNVIFFALGDNKVSEQITLIITRYILVSITSGIIALSSGIIVPAVFSITKSTLGEKSDSQSISGTILSINTLGSIAGLILVTYVMISFLGFSLSLTIIAMLYLASSFIVMLTSNYNRIATMGIVVLFLSFILIIPKEITFTKYYNGFWNIKGDLKFYKEGMYGTIAVFDVGNTRFLKINGIDEVPTDYNSLLSFKVMGNIPFLLKSEVSNVMVNALGGGITLSSVLHHLEKQNIDVVDICPDVKEALTLFSNYNYNVFEKRIWNFIEDDGRNFLKSYKGKFDIIVADATHPASLDSWMLFTKEFYKLAYEKLQDDGIMVQWIPIHNLENYDFVSILKTFNNVFSNSFLMITGVYTAIVGFKGYVTNLRIQGRDFEDLKQVGIDNVDKIKSLIFLSPKLLKILTDKERGEILSDFKSSVEFAEFHRRVAENTRYKNLSLILKYSSPIELSEFTEIDPKNHYSMILSKEALLEYWGNLHYEALKKIDKSLEIYPDNFYSKFLFSLIFPEFVQLVYKYQNQIKEKYGFEKYSEIVEYIKSKMKNLEVR